MLSAETPKNKPNKPPQIAINSGKEYISTLFSDSTCRFLKNMVTLVGQILKYVIYFYSTGDSFHASK